MPTDSPVPMVLIHGAWLSSLSWERFDEFFTAKGYDVTAPEWPRKARELTRSAPTATT